MSKAQQKKQEMENKIALNVINQRIRAAFDEGQKIGIYETVHLLLWVLHDKEGFGKTRLSRVYMALCDLADCLNSADVTGLTVEDIKRGLAEECNITIAPVK